MHSTSEESLFTYEAHAAVTFSPPEGTLGFMTSSRPARRVPPCPSFIKASPPLSILHTYASNTLSDFGIYYISKRIYLLPSIPSPTSTSSFSNYILPNYNYLLTNPTSPPKYNFSLFSFLSPSLLFSTSTFTTIKHHHLPPSLQPTKPLFISIYFPLGWWVSVGGFFFFVSCLQDLDTLTCHALSTSKSCFLIFSF